MRPCPQCQSLCDTTHAFCPMCGFPISKLGSEPDDPMVGRTLPGGYAVLELVGVGGMGRVYRAEQTALSRTVAIKVIHPHLLGEENTAARFITEARASSLLNHPNSVSVIDFGRTDQGELYLVMEFLRGKDLARVAYEEGPLSFRRIIRILTQVLAALEEAHHVGIIHRDLKPENIILETSRSGSDFVKVVDFGLAKIRESSNVRGITNPGIVCGTPEYMSPEQGRGDNLDARSDVYAVGVVLFQLLTGQLPFEAESPTQVVIMHLTEPPPDPRAVAPERAIPEVLVEVCLKALEKDLLERYANATQFGLALEDALTAIEAPIGSVKSSGRICPACQTEWPQALKFCGECGTPMVSKPKTLVPEEPDPIELPLLPISFRGRDAALARLEELFLDKTEQLTVTAVVGEPGVGKSRLVEKLTESLQAIEPVTVIVAGPDPYDAEVGYFALRSALEQLALAAGGPLEDLPSLRSEARFGLLEVFTEGDARPAEGLEALSLEARKFGVAEALRSALYAAGERSGRVLLVVDDLQRCDAASREAFLTVAEEPPFADGMLLLTADASIEIPSHLDIVHLESFAPQTVSDLFARAQVTIAAPDGRGFLPFYVDQLLRFTSERGGVAPTRIADLIADRIECLSPHARRVLHALCVAGDDFRVSQVESLVRDGTQIDEAMLDLESAGMIVIRDGHVSTCHPLFREVVLATIPRAARRELHGIMAELAEQNGLPLEVRALHSFHAERSFQALILLERLAKRARSRDDLPAAVTALNRGVTLARQELVRGQIDEPERALFLFLRKMGEALASGESLSEAEGVLREALDLARTVGNADDREQVLALLEDLTERQAAQSSMSA